jgi:hypothetical protein
VLGPVPQLARFQDVPSGGDARPDLRSLPIAGATRQCSEHLGWTLLSRA